MRFVLEWLLEQRGYVAIILAVIVFAITLVLRYVYELWWPWGIAMATVLGIVGIVAGNAKR